ncbi:MAG TPA: PD-(D/E)XK nuclease family protein, partial [Candidatus Baltobacteraceae bacterium]|nr:PD-(D/E)XK nuclease family protein [Candidatus Baltobacteraceae bacterium]
MSTATQAKKPIYIGPTGWKVYEFSHSQYSKYKQCPKRFEIERVKGWKQKDGATLEFGKAIESSVKAFYLDKADPVESFGTLWDLHRTNEKLQYGERESWDSFLKHGVGLMREFAATWERFPPRKPVFPQFKNPLKILDEASGNHYQTIPDLIDQDERGHFIADLKSLGNLINDEVPMLVANDMQLRTQAAATQIYRVALWNFCRSPKRADALTSEQIYAEVRAGLGAMRYLNIQQVALLAARETNGLTIDGAAEFLGISNPKDVTKEWKAATKADQSLADLAGEIVKALATQNQPRYIIQWVEATITQAHALEAVREEMSVVPLIQQGYFPRRGGVRF